MPLFDSFSKIFASLSPHRPRHRDPLADDRQRTQTQRRHLPSRHDRSLAQTRDVSASPSPSKGIPNRQNQFSLLSEDEDENENDLDESPRDTAALPQVYMPSHHGPSSEPKLISISRRASSGDASQMLAKDQSRKPREEQREEDRLLGGGKYRDSNAVRIRPGEGRKRIVPGSSAAFKPANHLNRNGRESGPVRAQGKTQPTALPEKNRPRLDEPFDFDQATRPNKRPRNNEHARPRDAIGKRATQLSLQTSPQRRVSPVSSETSGKIERNVIPRQQEEYRQVEEYMKMHRNHPRSRHNRRRPNQSEIPDEVFTSQAAKERRAAVELAADFSEREHVPKLNVRSKSPQRVAHSRESPDVLQGDITIPRLPKPTTTKQISGRQNPNNEPSPSPSRKRSPSDIQPTDFTSSPIQGSKRAKRSHKFSTRFEVKYLRFGPFKKQPHAEEPLVFHVDQNQEKIQLGRIICDSDEHENASIELRRIIGALLGDSESHKIRLKLARKRNSQLWSEKKINKIQIKPSVFMDRAFDHYGIKMAELSREPKMSFIEAAPSERERTRQPPTRQKISSTLQGDSEDLREKTDHINRNKLAEPLAKRGVEDDASKIQRVENEKGEEIPVKKFQPKPETERQTRSTGRRSTRLSDLFKNDDDGSTDLFSKYPLKEDPFRKEWKQPLVYPQNGKKKAEVTVEDRDRLRDDEFLNDNLIAFYMRFLQDHMERTNPEAAKQVYFFNSYFYDTLTKTPRGQRGINYSGVAKWTRNVNLFEYNYVVVPINQSAHWYVAIICNLPKLLGETEAIEAKPDVEESASSNDKSPLNQTESEEDQRNLQLRKVHVLALPLCPLKMRVGLEQPKTRQENRGKNLHEKRSKPTRPRPTRVQIRRNPVLPTNGLQKTTTTPRPPKLSTTSLKSKPTGPTPDPLPASQTPTTKKKGKGGQKYDPDQTTIITFDSLDLARSPTVRILRDYICEESSSKRGKGVEPKDIKGMRARQIPLQPNFSDCGLYLLAYLEKFVQDPDQFITKLLQREMDEKDDWPPLGSGLLRQRLRDFLDQLYREQERVKAGKCGAGPAGPKQEFLADQQPISHLLGPSSSSEADVEKKVDKSPEKTKTGDGSEKKEASENLPEKSRRSDSESDSDDSSTVDQLQLVPTGTAPTVSMTISSAPSGKDRSKNDSRQKKDEEVVEVPDSQEAKRDPSPIPSEAQPPKTEKKKGKADEPSKGKKSDLSKKNPTPTVEIQIRATPPPPSSPGKVRKSPRGEERNVDFIRFILNPPLLSLLSHTSIFSTIPFVYFYALI
ncbi:hypothetical protein N7481_002630 [Penicillium waksmanii]|uniref:uncharacterized protein n=1 Tax=Penicillium waksmanii TaxID=69791 RepID=UPI0025474DC0|nr:uncharacterized protein N7481_002630 [Penicillium waksmanii]KAJ5995653.1 hypothetical protein N7481_002630 [Penicillium waksmanii]